MEWTVRRFGNSDPQPTWVVGLGALLMEHGSFGHGIALDPELVRVPLIVGGPVATNRGWSARRVSGVVRNLDIAPTVVALAGESVPGLFQGRNLVPELSRSLPSDSLAPPSYA